MTLAQYTITRRHWAMRSIAAARQVLAFLDGGPLPEPYGLGQGASELRLYELNRKDPHPDWKPPLVTAGQQAAVDAGHAVIAALKRFHEVHFGMAKLFDAQRDWLRAWEQAKSQLGVSLRQFDALQMGRAA